MHRYKGLISLCSLTVILLGIYILIFDRLLHLKVFTPEKIGNLPMAVDTAVCFLLLGRAMLLRIKNNNKPSSFQNVLSFCTITIAITSLLDDAFNYKGMHWLMLGMAPQTAMCFVLTSLGLIFSAFKNIAFKKIAAYLFNILTSICLVITLGYIMDIPEFYSLFFVPMSVYASVGFIIFSRAGALLNPTLGVTGLFTGRRKAKMLARRIFIKVFIAAVMLGYLHYLDHKHLFFSHALSAALQTIILVIVGLVIICETSEKLNKAEEAQNTAQENLKLAVNSAPYALVISNTEGKILLANYQTELLYGFKRRELIGQSLKLLLPQKMHSGFCAWKSDFFRKQETMYYKGNEEYEMLTIGKNGKDIHVEMVFIPIKTESETLCLTSIVDITDRKKYEDIIKQQVQELQYKNQELEQFNYIASHDLQEPLRTVSNYIKLLEEDYPEQINDEIKSHLFAMDAAIIRMSTLVKSLLCFGKLGRDKKMTHINCNELLKNVLADLSGLIAKKEAVIEIDGTLPMLYGYETELHMLFQNLINNAVKFTKNETKPHVTISCLENEGFYNFSVADNGIGIEPQYYERIFHIFQRLNKAEEFEGHGIGLAHCKKIAEMHGGKIWAEARPEGGTIFTFTILNFKGL
jgi:PAS domain S-box-containing protein